MAVSLCLILPTTPRSPFFKLHTYTFMYLFMFNSKVNFKTEGCVSVCHFYIWSVVLWNFWDDGQCWIILWNAYQRASFSNIIDNKCVSWCSYSKIDEQVVYLFFFIGCFKISLCVYSASLVSFAQMKTLAKHPSDLRGDACSILPACCRIAAPQPKKDALEEKLLTLVQGQHQSLPAPGVNVVSELTGPPPSARCMVLSCVHVANREGPEGNGFSMSVEWKLSKYPVVSRTVLCGYHTGILFLNLIN